MSDEKPKRVRPRHDLPFREILAICGLSNPDEAAMILPHAAATIAKKAGGDRWPSQPDLVQLRAHFKKLLAGDVVGMPVGAVRAAAAFRFLLENEDFEEKKLGRPPRGSGGSGGGTPVPERRPTSPGVYVVRALQPSCHLWSEDPIAGQEFEIYEEQIVSRKWAIYWQKRDEDYERDLVVRRARHERDRIRGVLLRERRAVRLAAQAAAAEAEAAQA